MAKKLSEDQIKWILSVESTEAQQEIHKLTNANKTLTKANRERQKALYDLEMQGKRDSDGYRNLLAVIKENSTSIQKNSAMIRGLEDNMGDTALTMNQLKARAKELSSQLNATSKSTHPEEYAALEKKLTSTRTRMDELKNSGKNVGEGMNNTGISVGTLKAAFSAFMGLKVVEWFKSVVMHAYETRKEFAKYEAVLRNTSQSQEKANASMKMLQSLATNTPASLKEWTESYIKLINRGINPTSQELMKMGDLATSQGKPIDQFIEALLDAMTGENERLKEFGIKASKSGEITKYTFKGVTTEVQNTEAAISKYILSLGDLQGVQGSMTTQMGELEGMESNFGDTMDALYNKIGKRFEGFLKGLLSSSSQFVTELSDTFSTLSERFEEQMDNVVSLESNIKPLAERYDELTSKGALTKDEHVELNKIVNDLALAVPGAASAWDDYGKIVGINTKLIYDFIEAEKVRLRYMHKAEVEELQSEKRKIQRKLTNDKIEKYVKPEVQDITKTYSPEGGGYEQTVKYRKRTLKEEEELNKRIASNAADLAGINAQLSKITGEDLDNQVKRKVQYQKDSVTVRDKFNKMNKEQLNAWIKDEKHASDQFKEIAKEVYANRFSAPSMTTKTKKDKKVDYNKIALTNMDTHHDEELNRIRLAGQEQEKAEEQINQELLASDMEYYSRRISQLENFKLKEKDKAKKAAYDKEIVDLKTKRIKAEEDIEKGFVTTLDKTRKEELSSIEEHQSRKQLQLTNSLAAQRITKEEFDISMIMLNSDTAEKRLTIEQAYLNDVNSLELKNGEIKANAVKQANDAVLIADLNASKARLAQEELIHNMVKDFKGQFGTFTPEEETKAKEDVLEKTYTVRRKTITEDAAKNGTDAAPALSELDKANELAKEQLQIESQSRLNKVLEQNGILSLKDRYALEDRLLKQHLDKGEITQKQFDKIQRKRKIDRAKADFDAVAKAGAGAVQALQQAEMDNIDAKYDAEIQAAQGNSEEVTRLENEKAQKKLDVEKKYADANFAVKASTIIADTAVAIMTTLAQLGPIAGPIASVMIGAMGLAQLSSANSEREKVKSMTIGGASSSSSSQITGARVATGREDGGYIDIERAQDGKLFPGAEYNPNARGFIDKPTVIVGEGATGKSREWVASNAAVENPTIAPLLSILDKSQRAGTIRTLDLNQAIRARMAGYEAGGSITQTTIKETVPLAPSMPNDRTPEVLNELTLVLKGIKEDGIQSFVSLTQFEQQQALRDKARKIGSK